MAQQQINNGDSGLTVRNNLNAMFTELYGAIPSPIKLKGQSTNITQSIPGGSYVATISIDTVSGSPSVNIGTDPNGTDILDTTNPPVKADVSIYYPSTTPYYITITGGVVNIRIDIIQNYYD